MNSEYGRPGEFTIPVERYEQQGKVRNELIMLLKRAVHRGRNGKMTEAFLDECDAYLASKGWTDPLPAKFLND